MSNNRVQTRERIKQLVEAFQANANDYRRSNSTYNETQLRTDFLDPLFRALGWDVDNTKGLPQNLREVVQEATIEANEDKSSKKPDYAFRLARHPKFFLEAKKPSIRVGQDRGAAFQTRRYGFSASHPIAVLSNFDRTIIYDTRNPPKQEDDPQVAVVAIYTYEELLTKFDEIYDRLSRESVCEGGFDEIFGGEELPIGYRPFDQYFLQQIESWRKLLAANIAQRNPTLGAKEINFFVQKILNRIIFLRICEDRNLERYESLRDSGLSTTYETLKATFEQAENRYNSGLFDLLEDPTLDIQVDSNVLVQIINDLYYPRSPYTFAVVDVTVLGAIYEQFISKRIEIGSRRRVTLSDKPEVRVSGGVFVTPRKVVDTIVDSTLGPLCNEKSPEEVASLKIADIACGSGTFLLSAFEFLQNWYISWYINDGIEKHNGKEIYEVGGGNWKLTLAEKGRIILNNIFGVDIDDQAVEVTQFGLLLKVIEDEDEASVQAYRRRTGQQALPSLDENIKCGNSLVDVSSLRHFIPNPSIELLVSINSFDWASEFPEVMRRGGFNAIVGNPPYIRIQRMVRYAPEEAQFYQSYLSGYASAQHDNFDKYQLFVERAISLLLGGGRLGYIIPHKFMTLKSGRALRQLIAQGRFVREIVHFGVHQVFPKSTTYTCLLLLEKQSGTTFWVEHVGSLSSWMIGYSGARHERDLSTLDEEAWSLLPPEWEDLFSRLRSQNATKLRDVAEIFVGVQTSADNIYIVHPTSESDTSVTFNNSAGRQWTIEKGVLRPCLHDVQLHAFTPPHPNSYIIFPYEISGHRASPLSPSVMRRHYPLTLRYLRAHRQALSQRNVQGGPPPAWYRYGRSQSLTKFSGEKIILPILSTTPRYTLDNQDIVVTGGGNGPYYLVRPKPQTRLSIRYLLAILCYPVIEAMVSARSSHFRGDYYSHGKQFIAPLPVKMLNLDHADEKRTHDQIVDRVNNLINVSRSARNATTPRERVTFIRQREQLLDELFRELDQLYGVDTGLRRNIGAAFAFNNDTERETA